MGPLFYIMINLRLLYITYQTLVLSDQYLDTSYSYNWLEG